MLDVQGIHGYNIKNATNELLAIGEGLGDAGQLRYLNSSTWTDIASANGFITDSKVEFETFIDFAFMVGSDNASTPNFNTTASLTGTTYSEATNVTSAPKAKYIKKYKDLLYLINIEVSDTHYPNRFFYSDAVSAGAITWTSTNWVEVDADDGDQLMSGAVNSDRLVLFKEYSMYRWDTNQIVRIADIGTTSHRSVKNLDIYTFFFNRDGIFKYAGGRPIKISRGIDPYIKGMTSSPYDVVGSVDDEHYRLFIGNTTVDGESFTNMELEYNYLTDAWTTNVLADKVQCADNFVISNVRRVYFGTDTGGIYKRAEGTDTVYSDRYVDSSNSGLPISAEIETRNFDGGVPELKKFFGDITVFMDRIQHVDVLYSLDKKKFDSLGALTESISRKGLDGKNCNFIKFKISENSKSRPFVFNGIVLNANQEDSIE